MRLKTNLLRRHRERPLNFMLPGERRRKIRNLCWILLCLAVGHVLGMMWFESLSVWDATWLTLTTITTVGYGDLSPATHGGRLTTMIMMYGFGIFLVAQIAGEWIDYRFDRFERKRKGLWTWDMNDHILIINTPTTDGDRYLEILTGQIQNSQTLSAHPIQILSDHYPDGLPIQLVERGVMLHQGAPEGSRQLEEVNVEDAAYIIVLAGDTHDYRSDSVTLDILDRLEQYQLKGHVVAECLQDENRQRLREHGADGVIRPVRAYPELLVRALVAPGSETILEDLFQNEGVHSHRYNVILNGLKWSDVVNEIVVAGYGTPIGYLNDAGIVTNPLPDEVVHATAIFMLVSFDRVATESDIAKVLSNCGAIT
ncbi:MAG: ion channel [Pseudomonadales bacterium]